MSSEDLKKLRDKIDNLDAEILELISKRSEAALHIANLKRPDSDPYRPEREAQVLQRITELNSGPLSDEEMARLFREIMSACLALEQPLKVAYLGPEGTFTQQAVLKHFGQAISTLPLNSIENIFREVESSSAQYGVVPIENSTEGVITHTLDMFMRSSLNIVGEVELRIHHHILSNCKDKVKIKKLYAHPQSFAQCRVWLESNLPNVENISVSSNAKAAQQASSDKTFAAIAGEAASVQYDLPILCAKIEDNPNNVTRFLIIGSKPVPPSGQDKTSILVSALNQPGALYKLLGPFSKQNISLTRIESRPSQSANWEYVFFLDIEGHIEDKNLKQALEQLQKNSDLFTILGSYPKAVL